MSIRNLAQVEKNLLKTCLIAVITLFVGLVIAFLIWYNLPGNKAAAILASRGILLPSQEQIDAIIEEYGLNQPAIIQFGIFLIRFFTGRFNYFAWDYSSNYATPVSELLSTAVPRMIEILILPLIIAGICGYLLGKYSLKTKYKFVRVIIQLFSAVGFAFPIFFVAILLQNGLYGSGWPIYGYKSPIYPNPLFLTGFRIWDSLVSGNWLMAADTFQHYVLPSLTLGISITPFITWQVRSSSLNRSQDHSLIYHTARTALFFGMIIYYATMVDIMFNLSGFGSLFIEALMTTDFFLIMGCLFVIIIMFIFVTFLSNIFYIAYPHMIENPLLIRINSRISKRYEKRADNHDSINQESPIRDNKYNITKILKNIFIGFLLFIIGFFVFIAIAPQLFTPYSYADATLGIFSNSWFPPSPAHPLGTAIFGRDVWAQIVFGIQDSLIFAGQAILIGFSGGLLFALILNRLNKWYGLPIIGIMMFVFIIPFIFLIPSISAVFGVSYTITFLFTGIFLIPLFTRVFFRTQLETRQLFRSMLIYTPLFLGFTMIIYSAIGFIGFATNPIQLGNLFDTARYHFISNFHAVFWPGLIIFVITTSFFLLHEVFQKYPR